MKRLLGPLCLAAVVGVAPVAWAEPPETLPAPRETPQPLPTPQGVALPFTPAPGLLPLVSPGYPPPQPSVPPEFGRMSIWQAYAPDRTGRFLPVVITTPSGAYFRYNHVPFPWTTTHQLEYMPYALD